PPASARASLPLPAAAEAQRSVPKAQSSVQYVTVLDVSVTGQVCRPGSPGAGSRRTPRGEENTAMRLTHQWWSGLVAAVLVGLVGVTTVAAGEQFIPVLAVREGAVRSLGIPITNGLIDYLTLLNERDGGINGVKLIWEECETVYDVDRAVECYERLK